MHCGGGHVGGWRATCTRASTPKWCLKAEGIPRSASLGSEPRAIAQHLSELAQIMRHFACHA